MLRATLLLLLASSLLSACAASRVPGQLYPIQGPLSLETPLPIASCQFSSVLTTSSLSAKLPGGEAFNGYWSRVSQDDPFARNMSLQWDDIYGNGFFAANVLGNPAFGRAELTGSQGTLMDVQFYLVQPGNLSTARGVAVDNKGNLFKLTF